MRRELEHQQELLRKEEAVEVASKVLDTVRARFEKWRGQDRRYPGKVKRDRKAGVEWCARVLKDTRHFIVAMTIAQPTVLDRGMDCERLALRAEDWGWTSGKSSPNRYHLHWLRGQTRLACLPIMYGRRSSGDIHQVIQPRAPFQC